MKIFLSYGHDANAWIVERIADDLDAIGHDVWIDRKRLPPGRDWRRMIVDGLRDSELAFSCLSAHYVASEVCLDELAIALSEKSGNVHTILLESPADFQMPVGVSDKQWLNMQDWQSRKDADATTFENWYQERLADIHRILDDPDNQRFAGEIEWLANILRPAPFAARMGELLDNGFIGRKWLLTDIERWRTSDRTSKVFCITGEPGIGKSALAAWLAHCGRAHVVAVHFCQHDHPTYGSPSCVIRSIACQMAGRLPDYRRFLIDALRRELKPYPDDKRSPQQRLDSLSEAELFDLLLADPAYFGLRGGRDRYIVIIDALDEAGHELARFLAQKHTRLPEWLGFVVTSRPNEAPIKAHLAALKPKYLSAEDDRNLNDLRDAAQQWVDDLKLSETEATLRVDRLLSASTGNFLYLTLLRRFAENENVDFDWAKFEVLPPDLTSLYLTYMARACLDEEKYRKDLAPLLRLLVASRGPLEQTFIEKALAVDEEDFQLNTLRPLGSLLKRKGGHIELFHKSMSDWLTNLDLSGEYYISQAKAQKALGNAVFAYKQSHPNGLVNLLRDVQRCDRRAHLLSVIAPTGEKLRSSPIAHVEEAALKQRQSLKMVLLFQGARRVEDTARKRALDMTEQAMKDANLGGVVDALIENSVGCVRVDALIRDGQGEWILFGESDNTSVKPWHIERLAVQTHVLAASGIQIARVQMAYTNTKFELAEEGDYRNFFGIEDVSSAVLKLVNHVPRWIESAQIALQNLEPTTPTGRQCNQPSPCRFLETHCDQPPEQADTPLYPVEVLRTFRGFVERMRAQGIRDIRDVPESELPKNSRAHRIWLSTRHGSPILEPAGREALSRFPYPHYFIDFEAVIETIPRWIGTRPNMTVPYAWSCHLEDVDGGVTHAEFIDTSGLDPRRNFAETLLSQLESEGTFFAYNAPFERRCISDLADRFPDISERLMALSDRFVDLLSQVREHYYHPSMEGSFSLKNVFPTLGADLPATGPREINDGQESMNAYRTILWLRQSTSDSSLECERLQSALVSHCKQDSLMLCLLARKLAGRSINDLIATLRPPSENHSGPLCA